MLSLILTEPGKTAGPCGLCKALYGSTCCEVKYGEGPRFPMTYGEALRIARYCKLALTDAVELRRVGKDESAELERMAGSTVAGLIVNGRGLYLPTVNRACPYLGSGGCTLPAAIKPHLCYLFPFSRGPRGWRVGELVRGTGYCFGQDCALGSTSVAMELFGLRPELLERTYQRWQRDIKGHAEQIKRLRKR